MNIYKEAEKQLAELLGWTDLYWLRDDCLLGLPPNDRKALVKVTEWCSDDAAAFKLMVSRDVSWLHMGDYLEACCFGESSRTHYYNQHTAKNLCIRYAIVQSVIQYLKGSK